MYASLFPRRTDRLVLDSAVDPNGRWRANWRQFGPAGEFRFPDLAGFLAANDATYHLGATPADVQAKFLELIELLDRDPIILSDGTVFNGSLFRLVTFGGLYHDGDFPVTAELWQEVNEAPGDAAGLERPIASLGALPESEVPVDNYPSVHFANLCGDVEWPRSVEQYRAEYDGDRELYPLFGAIGSNIHPCAFWPAQPIEPLVEISARGPRNVLIIQNLRDPATPHWGALAMHEALGQRSRMVTADQGGHGVLFARNACAIGAALTFLASGVLPDADLFCPAEAPPAPVVDRVGSDRDRALREVRRRIAPPLSPAALPTTF